MLSGAGDPPGHLVEGPDSPPGGHVDGRAAHGALDLAAQLDDAGEELASGDGAGLVPWNVSRTRVT
jgi:hypothetical protein